MLCDAVRRFAYFYLDGQLSQVKGSDFNSHIEHCRDCDDRVTIHRRLRNFFKGRLSVEAAPERLRERILMSVRAEARP
jgi:hypothetical protein